MININNYMSQKAKDIIIGIIIAIIIIAFVFWLDAQRYIDWDFNFKDFINWTGRG